MSGRDIGSNDLFLKGLGDGLAFQKIVYDVVGHAKGIFVSPLRRQGLKVSSRSLLNQSEWGAEIGA